MPRAANPTGRKKAVAGKRYPLNMRTTYEIRRGLEAAAASSGRSLAQEAEHRLEQSFNTAAETERLFGSAEGFAFITIVARAMHLTGAFADTGSGHAHWLRNPVAYEEAVAAADRIFEAMRPSGDARRPAYLHEGTGKKIADLVLEKLAEGDPNK
jgi:hypothetical protein